MLTSEEQDYKAERVGEGAEYNEEQQDFEVAKFALFCFETNETNLKTERK